MAASHITSVRQVPGDTLLAIAQSLEILPSQVENVYVCTPFQEGVMADSHAFASSYTDRYVYSLESSVDIGLLSHAVDRVVQLNPIFRTRIVDCSLGVLQVVVEAGPVMQQSSASLVQYLENDRAAPMGLGTPLLRSTVLVEDRAWVLTIHHAICDYRVSMAFMMDIRQLCENQTPPKRLPFKYFVKQCLTLDRRRAKQFWNSKLTGCPAVFPHVPTGYIPRGTERCRREIAVPLKQTAPALLPSYVEAALICTLQGYANSDCVVYGLVFSGQTASNGNRDPLGPTIATVPMQVDIRPAATVIDLIKATTQQRRDMSASPALQYGLAKIKSISEDAAISCGFQTVLNMRLAHVDSPFPQGVTFRAEDDVHRLFALCFNVDDKHDRIVIEACFDPHILPARKAERTLAQFVHMLQTLMEVPSETELQHLEQLNSHDHQQLLEWNLAVPPPVDASLHGLFHDIARQHPHRAAVDAWDGCASFQHLDSMASLLARDLRSHGVREETPVCFVFDKSIFAVIAVLAILKAEGVCVPIEPAHPLERKRSIVASVNASIALASTVHCGTISDLIPCVLVVGADLLKASTVPPTHAELETVSSHAAAFIMFTGGSTGVPKGVVLTHRSLGSAMTAFGQRVGWDHGTRVLQFAAHVWDASILEMVGPLLFGACVCVPSAESRESGLADFINSYSVNFAFQTATALANLSPEEVPSLQTMVSCGEAVSPHAVQTWGGSKVRFINAWGPCEASICAALTELTPESAYPESIGTPVGSRLWLADLKNPAQLVPIGATGEIIIEGPGVARGYIGDDAKTAASFIPPPAWAPDRHTQDACSGHSFYRTGDLAAHYPDGSLCFLGRLDRQVKIRGQRFELAEVESVLVSSEHVGTAVVTAHVRPQQRKELVAVLTLEDAQRSFGVTSQEMESLQGDSRDSRLSQIHDLAKARLPPYMIPTAWFVVNQIPRNDSRKIDRVRVEEWIRRQDMSEGTIASDEMKHLDRLTPPVSASEKTLQSIWASVFGIDASQIGRETPFMSRGDSIAAMRVATRCRRSGLEISVATLLRSESLADAALESRSLDQCEVSAAAQEAGAPNGSASERAEALPDAVTLSQRSTHFPPGSVETVAAATDVQAWMLAVGELQGGGFQRSEFTFEAIKGEALETARLQKAWEDVVGHLAILRTVFVQHGNGLYQLVFRHSAAKSILATGKGKSTRGKKDSVPWMGRLPRFEILPGEDMACRGFRITIDHSLYDAVVFSIVLRELCAVYSGHQPSSGPHFHDWISRISHPDTVTAAQNAWGEILRGSSMTYLFPKSVNSPEYDFPVDSTIKFAVDVNSAHLLPGTLATALKAAWAIVLAHALDTEDVVFGEFSANRNLGMESIDQVAGPCLSLLPVRAFVQRSTTVASLIEQLQQQSIMGTSFHAGVRSIIDARVTGWPSWTSFGSILVFENHRSVDSTLDMNGTRCSLTADGRSGAAADVIITAYPGPTQLELEFSHSSARMPRTQARWITNCLSNVLISLSSALDQSIEQRRDELLHTMGAFKMPLSVPDKDVSSSTTLPTPQARDAVRNVWERVGFSVPDSGQDQSVWECGADLVAVMLLSEQFRQEGYRISLQDILQHPTQRLQGILIDCSIQAANNGS